MKKIFIVFVVIFSTSLASAQPYQYVESEDDTKWVFRGKVGYAFVDYSSKQKAGDPALDAREKDAFSSVAAFELELDYFINKRFSVGTALGYQPQGSNRKWEFGTESDVGRVSAIPISAMVKFHIAPYGAIRPYIGAGYHYSFITSSYKKIEHDNTHGPLFGAGFDWWMNPDWAFNMELKKYFMEVEADYSKLAGEELVFKDRMSPLAIMAGVSRRF